MNADPNLRKSRFLRFLLAGAANTIIGIALYPVLLWLVPPLRARYMLALAISQVTCVCLAYVIHKLGVFRTRGNVVREFSVFSTFYVIVLAANWLILPLLVEAAHIAPAIAQLIFIVPVVLGSYLWHSRVTFAFVDKNE